MLSAATFRATAAVALFFSAMLLSGCSSIAGMRQPALQHAESSSEALAAAFLARLHSGEPAALQELRLTQDEFCTFVFPELPAARLPNVPCDFVWSQATLKSDAGLSRTLAVHRGRSYTLQAVRFRGEPTRYPSYTVHNEAVLTVKDERGDAAELRLFGSVLEMDGQYKLFSFVTD
jgi:hypothetical protein